MGSSLYRIKVDISPVPARQWQGIARDCARSIDSLVELLHGQLSTSVMERITRPGTDCSRRPRRSRSAAVVRTGRPCASTSRRRCTRRPTARRAAGTAVHPAQRRREGTHREGREAVRRFRKSRFWPHPRRLETSRRLRHRSGGPDAAAAAGARGREGQQEGTVPEAGKEDFAAAQSTPAIRSLGECRHHRCVA